MTVGYVDPGGTERKHAFAMSRFVDGVAECVVNLHRESYSLASLSMLTTDGRSWFAAVEITRDIDIRALAQLYAALGPTLFGPIVPEDIESPYQRVPRLVFWQETTDCPDPSSQRRRDAEQ